MLYGDILSGVSLFCIPLSVHKNATFYGQQPQKHHHIHEIARFYGQDDLRATNELPMSDLFRLVANGRMDFYSNLL